MKKCATCKTEKPYPDFNKRTRNKDGYNESCRACSAIRAKIYRELNRDKVLAAKKEHHHKNKEEINKRRRIQEAAEPPLLKEIKRHKSRERWTKNKKSHSERRKDAYCKNKDVMLSKGKQYREENSDKIRLQRQKAREQEEQKIKNRQRLKQWKKQQYAENPFYVLKTRVQARIRAALRKRTAKADKTIELVGCTFGELQTHLEKQFKPGMSWDNMHLWHIDHIKPCAKFDLSDPEQQRACFHYTNTQPLWEAENIAKGIKFIDP